MYNFFNIRTKRGLITTIFLLALILVITGLIIQLSISSPESLKNTQGATHSSIFFGQLRLIIISIPILFAISIVNIRKIKESVLWIYPLGFLLLLLPFSPLGVSANGARRWFRLGPMQFQPSEFAKIFLIITLAFIIELGFRRMISKKAAYLSGLGITMIYAMLILASKSLSLTIQVIAIFFLMYYACGYIPLIWQFATGMIFLMGGVAAIFSTPYRVARLFGDKEQAKLAIKTISSGGLFGTGYGNGMGRNFYLPEVQTDFVFAGFSEEWGLIGSVILLLVFTALIYLIFYSTRFVRTAFEKMVIAGIGFMIADQIIFHVFINLAILPTTGVTLPFISQGGSSIMTLFISLGVLGAILLNIDDEVFYKLK